MTSLDATPLSFLATATKCKGPQNDPQGTILKGYSPTVQHTDNGQISLAGLPQGFTVEAGDLFSWQDSSGTFCLRRMTKSVTAGGNGQTGYGSTDVGLSIAEGTPVKLVEPVCKALIIPGTAKTGTAHGGLKHGMAFQWVQDFRP